MHYNNYAIKANYHIYKGVSEHNCFNKRSKKFLGVNLASTVDMVLIHFLVVSNYCGSSSQSL